MLYIQVCTVLLRTVQCIKDGAMCKTGDRNKGRNCFSEKGEIDTSHCIHMNNKEEVYRDPGEN